MHVRAPGFDGGPGRWHATCALPHHFNVRIGAPTAPGTHLKAQGQIMLQKFVKATALLVLLGVPIACDSGTDPVVPASVELTSTVDVLPAGQTTQLVATVRDEDEAPIADADVTFTSSDEAIATVDEEGLLTGVAEGEVAITATAGAHGSAVNIFVFEAADLCTTGLRLIPGESVRASLQEGDCDLGDGTFIDLWFFELAQQTTVTVEMTSTDVDSYLFLYDEQGNLLTQDDNGAGGVDAEVQSTLEAGIYWVIANHWPPEGSEVIPGAYTITLSTGTSAFLAPAAVTSVETRSRTFDGDVALLKR